MKLNCLIVDDEMPAVKVIESHLSHLNDIEISGVCHNAMDAFSILQKQSIDLLFLDIQMPKMSGLSLIRSLKKVPHVILTTAHRDYALDGYELDVADYLLKPIGFERFMAAVSKVYRLENRSISIPSDISISKPELSPPFIYIKTDRQYVKVLLDDILYIESLKNHVKIVTAEKNYLTLQSISQMESKLSDERFFRIHRSYLVAHSKVEAFSNSNLTVGGKLLPIGRMYKKAVLEKLSFNLI